MLFNIFLFQRSLKIFFLLLFRSSKYILEIIKVTLIELD